MTSKLRELINKSNYSSVILHDEGYHEYKGFGYRTDDPRSFNSKEEIDEYFKLLLEKEEELLKSE